MPNRGIAECPNRGMTHVDGVPRGRADTRGFDRGPNKDGQQVTEFGVLPLPRKNTQQEARIYSSAGFLFFLARLCVLRKDRLGLFGNLLYDSSFVRI